MKKILAINLFILGIIFSSIEILSYSLLRYKEATFDGIFIAGLLATKDSNFKELNNPCLKMVTAPYLKHIHLHQNKCNIPPSSGKVDGQYIIHYPKEETQNSIVTLGGSTTDGFYFEKIPQTWPNHLQNILNKRGINLTVYNGGTGGYGSSNELLKLTMDLPRLKKKPKYVISLNGINDMPSYRVGDKYPIKYEERYPFLNWIDINLLRNYSYINQHEVKYKYFPSTLYLIDIIISKSNNIQNNQINESLNSIENKNKLPIKNWEKSIHMKNSIYTSAAEQWFYNVQAMEALSSQFGAKYYVFLQPTMGINNYQIPKKKDSNDFYIYQEKLLNNSNLGRSYLKTIRKHYLEMKHLCSKISYCIDISNKVPPKGDVYLDPRHHNSKGNKEIAIEIFNQIF